MSSGSSGRYQSRLFNFVHQQSRRLTQRWEKTFRQVQVATKWGAEALLYPLFLLLQSAESKVKTLYTREPQSRLKLQPNYSDRPLETSPTADTPIQRVLEAVHKLPSQETTVPAKTSPSFHLLAAWWQKLFPHSKTNNSPLAQFLTISDNSSSLLTSSQPKDVLQRYLPQVQGIATTIENRRLVLVTANNEILDILTLQQQTKLFDRIISEVASYWHYQQLALAEQQTELLPEINRLLAKLTGENPSNIQALTTGRLSEISNTGKFLEVLDAVVAKLEAKTLMPVQQSSQNILQLTQTKLNVFLYGKDDLVTQSDNLARRSLNFQALIEAAINYFFGVGKEKKLHSNDLDIRSYKNSQALPKIRQPQPQNTVPDPWLTWDDLFGNSDLVTEQKIAPTSTINPSLPPSLSARLSAQMQVGSGLVKPIKPNRNLRQIQKVSSVQSSDVSEILQHQNHNNQVEIKSDWIEIKAISMEYEKHFLEKTLEWLDHTMLWLEEILVKLLNLLRSLWQSK